jgi:hypothetical protein
LSPVFLKWKATSTFSPSVIFPKFLVVSVHSIVVKLVLSGPAGASPWLEAAVVSVVSVFVSLFWQPDTNNASVMMRKG